MLQPLIKQFDICSTRASTPTVIELGADDFAQVIRADGPRAVRVEAVEGGQNRLLKTAV